MNTREDVVAAAGRMFARYGYQGTSMRELGRELGLLVSSLYSHIGSKQDLLLEVVARGEELFGASVKRVPAGANGRERLRGLVAGHIDVVLDHRDEVRTFLNEARSLAENHRARVVEARNRYEESFREAIRAGVEDGSLRPETDAALTAIFLLSVLNALDRWFSESGRLSRRELADAVMSFAVR